MNEGAGLLEIQPPFPRTYPLAPSARELLYEENNMKSNSNRKILIIEYDVTDLTPKQIEHLMLEAVVQGETTDAYDDNSGHPDVPVITTKVVDRTGNKS